jgi:hypothetical protein
MNATYTQSDLDTTISTLLQLAEAYQDEGSEAKAASILAAVRIAMAQRDADEE